MAGVSPEVQLKFLMHMLERSCRHADTLGGGSSITSAPSLYPVLLLICPLGMKGKLLHFSYLY